jgi:hypothetical protein
MVNQKKALQKLWLDRLTVMERHKIIDPEDGSTGFEYVVVIENEPCKLSFSTLNTTNPTTTDAEIVQVTKVFLDEAIQIKPGSKITVQRRDDYFEYAQSGLPGIFTNHQEIVLVPWEKWA